MDKIISLCVSVVVSAGGVFVSGNECIEGKLLAVRKEMETHEEDKKKENTP